MKFVYRLLILAALIITFSSTSSAQEKFIVSSDWLSKHLNDKNLVLLQVAREEDFNREHIPGAAYIPYDKYAPEEGGLSRQMPSIEQLVSVFEEYDVGSGIRGIF